MHLTNSQLYLLPPEKRKKLFTTRKKLKALTLKVDHDPSILSREGDNIQIMFKNYRNTLKSFNLVINEIMNKLESQSINDAEKLESPIDCNEYIRN